VIASSPLLDTPAPSSRPAATATVVKQRRALTGNVSVYALKLVDTLARYAPMAMTCSQLAVLARSMVVPREEVNVLQAWLSALPKQERTLLDALVAVYPSVLNRAELAARYGYSPTSSSFQVAIRSLQRNALIKADGRGIWVTPILVVH